VGNRKSEAVEMDASDRVSRHARRGGVEWIGADQTHTEQDQRARAANMQIMFKLAPETWVCVINRRARPKALLDASETRHVLAIEPRLQDKLREILEQIAREQATTTDEPEPCREGGLTRRQREIARMVKDGASNKVIARDLGLSVGTVKVHMHRIFRALRIENRVQLAMLAIPY
jgi:DNA-binding NarL/FixJ family response regulator